MIFGRRKNVTLVGDQKESPWSSVNPGRGFLHLYTFRIEEEPDEEALDPAIAEDETIVLVEVALAAYRDRPIDEDARNHLHRILTFFRKKEKDIILRVCYDIDGNATENEPSDLATVQKHIEQLAPVIDSYRQEIFLLQGLLVGDWGEMHSSRFASDHALTTLYRTFRLSEIGDRYLAVRTPHQIRLFLAENDKLRDEEPYLKNLDKLALFDDAILADDTDMGTYAPGKREEELDFLRETCIKVPVGGETVSGSGEFTAEQVVETLRKMQVNYLSSQYDEKQLSRWKQMPYEGGTLYEYIAAHLGYRIFIKSLEWNRSQEKLILRIENTGFGGLLETAEFTIKISRRIKKDLYESENMDLTGEDIYEYKPEQRIAHRVHHAAWAGGQELELEFPLQNLPKGNYVLSLELARKKDGKRIWFVNEDAAFLDKVPMVQT